MELKKQNMVEFDEINVIDFQEYLGVNYQINKDKIVEIPKLNVFQYYILGKIVTKIRNKEIKKQNKKRKMLNMLKSVALILKQFTLMKQSGKKLLLLLA